MRYHLLELVEYARERSPFYRKLYARLPRNLPLDLSLSSLPPVEQAEFWKANDWKSSQVLTGPARGIVFKSGGTTGSPKFSVYTREEWETFTRAFGRGLDAGGLRPGDRVANLFYAGELYASFLFIHDSLARADAEPVVFPFAGIADPEAVLHAIEDLGITVLAGVPTHLVGLAERLRTRGATAPTVSALLFGGESVYDDQRELLRQAFPSARITSIGYASVDAGLLGYVDEGCQPDEHRAFGRDTLLEIVDEATGEPIREAGRTGRLLVTNLTRRLMPIIRYPAGDRAVWVEPAGSRGAPSDRKFRLLGRSEEAARLGGASLYYEDLRPVLASVVEKVGGDFEGFQLLLGHEQGKDRLTIRVAVSDPSGVARDSVDQLATAEIYRARPMLDELAAKGAIHPPRWEWVGLSGLMINARTGKLRRVLDQRQQA